MRNLLVSCTVLFSLGSSPSYAERHAQTPTESSAETPQNSISAAASLKYLGASGLNMAQRSKLTGDYDFFLSKQGFRGRFKDKPWSHVAKPPTWRIHAINTDKQLYYFKVKAGWWDRAAATISGADAMKGAAITKVGYGVIAGIPAVKYHIAPKQSIENYSLDCWIAQDMTAPKEIVNQLCANAQTPIIDPDHIPLRAMVANGKAKGQITFDTLSMKKTKTSSGNFAVPANYKKVDSVEQIMLGGDDSLIKDLLP